jgi:hypothetical protein
MLSLSKNFRDYLYRSILPITDIRLAITANPNEIANDNTVRSGTDKIGLNDMVVTPKRIFFSNMNT